MGTTHVISVYERACWNRISRSEPVRCCILLGCCNEDKKVKPSKVNSNAPYKKRQKPFNPLTVPNHGLSNPTDDPIAISVNSERSHAPKSPPFPTQSVSEEVDLPSQSAGQSQATRNINEEQNYILIRANCASTLQKRTYLQLQQRKATFLRESLLKFLTDAALLVFCQGCGCPAKDCATHASRPSVEVNFISLGDSFKLDIPIYECSRYNPA
jgi:hypothetical protein